LNFTHTDSNLQFKFERKEKEVKKERQAASTWADSHPPQPILLLPTAHPSRVLLFVFFLSFFRSIWRVGPDRLPLMRAIDSTAGRVVIWWAVTSFLGL
jgi:hypothetical protein